MILKMSSRGTPALYSDRACKQVPTSCLMLGGFKAVGGGGEGEGVS